MTEIYTAKIGIQDPNELNVSRKSGDGRFAPTWDLVHMYKAGEIGPTEYTGIYLKLMQKSYQENRKEWTDIKDHPKIVLTCYCRSGVFCHRVLLAKFMEEVCKIGTYKGEL